MAHSNHCGHKDSAPWPMPVFSEKPWIPSTCQTHSNCDSCTNEEKCYWCQEGKTCHPECMKDAYSCGNGWTRNCGSLQEPSYHNRPYQGNLPNLLYGVRGSYQQRQAGHLPIPQKNYVKPLEEIHPLENDPWWLVCPKQDQVGFYESLTEGTMAFERYKER